MQENGDRIIVEDRGRNNKVRIKTDFASSTPFGKRKFEMEDGSVHWAPRYRQDAEHTPGSISRAFEAALVAKELAVETLEQVGKIAKI